MTLVVASAAVLGFALVLARSRLGVVVQRIVRAALDGVTAVLDRDLDDLAKERAARRAGLRLLWGAFGLAWRFGLALGAAGLVVFAADASGVEPTERVLDMMMRPAFIVGISVAAAVVWWALVKARMVGRRRPAEKTAYAEADQLMHRLAFANRRMLLVVARLENRIFHRSIQRVSLAPPVFIVSLPRGGTTALLNALHRLPGVATHEYRDMPFVTAPLLWSRLGGDRSKRVEKRERAHGDGLEIDLDSPEAFDEVVWRAHWPQKYASGRIQTFGEADLDDDATDDFVRHHAKVALVRHGRSADGCRYVSKNNANIGRLRVLDRMFPGCSIVVALRRPAAHAASLHRQHERFLRLHAEDPFVRDYMRDIGHLEFGELHQPIDFAGLADLVGAREPSEPDYWLAYWIAAFEEVARHQGEVVVVQQDDLRARPQATMERVCSSLRIDSAGTDFTSEFRPGADPTPEDLFSPDLLARADALYERVAAKAMAADGSGGDTA
jgi:Sulfotransferase family